MKYLKGYIMSALMIIVFFVFMIYGMIVIKDAIGTNYIVFASFCGATLALCSMFGITLSIELINLLGEME